jgi:hypothetical protein
MRKDFIQLIKLVTYYCELDASFQQRVSNSEFNNKMHSINRLNFDYQEKQLLQEVIPLLLDARFPTGASHVLPKPERVPRMVQT